jgi:hypothetical protein
MSTLTIEIADDLAARLAAASERERVPASRIVVEALEKALTSQPADLPAGKSLYDAMVEVGALGCIDSGTGDLSTNPRHLEGYGLNRK